ncbi:MAG: EutP/PduV family microcompartment system protein [Anaerovoracaceae bacterium]
MVIGPKGCGKTTLVNYINDYDGPLRRTQDTIYGRETIDVPSAYIENAWMYKHMIALAQDAWCILLLLDQSRTAESILTVLHLRIPLSGDRCHKQM